MKQISNKFYIIALLGVTVVTAALPYAASAATTTLPLPEAVQGNFCIKAQEIETSFKLGLSNNIAAIKNKNSDQVSNLKKARATRDQKMNEIRADWDLKDDEYFSKLDAKADTEAKRAAVAEFRSAIERAVEARRVTTDETLAVYRKGVDQLLASRQATIDTVVENYQDGMEILWNKAAADCVAGVSEKTVKENVKTGVKQLKAKFIEDKKQLNVQNEKISPLLTTKKQALIRADANFRLAVKNAQTALKAVLEE
jgi:hypothetical protein